MKSTYGRFNIKDKIKLNYVGDLPDVYCERNVSRDVLLKINDNVKMNFLTIYDVRRALQEIGYENN